MGKSSYGSKTRAFENADELRQMTGLGLRDWIALGSLFMSCGFGVGFVMVTRNMVHNLKLDVKRINGMPERVARIEAIIERMDRDKEKSR